MTRHNHLKQDIVDLEVAYWEAMKAKDGRRTSELSGEETLVTNAHGVTRIPRNTMGSMTESGEWRLTEYELRDIEVMTPADDVAIIAYTVRQKVEMGGKPQVMKAADCSTWVRGEQGWECHAHCETMLSEEA